jgi:hypothetical protein
MKTVLKLTVIGACALAASTTAALATSELPRGLTTGLSIGTPMPEGVYDISIGSYGGWAPKTIVADLQGHSASLGQSEAYAIPAWIIWWTPWQIAGGRVVVDTATGLADLWDEGQKGRDSWLNTLVEAGIGWNLGGGLGISVHAGAWLPSTQLVPSLLGRDYTAFQGAAAISYTAGGWNLSATGIYGSGGGGETISGYPFTAQQASWFNLDLTAAKHFGKFETGLVAYGSWDMSDSGALTCATTGGLAAAAPCKQHQFAVGSLAGYDFGTFIAQAKFTTDVEEENYRGKETRGTLTLITRLWKPEASLK